MKKYVVFIFSVVCTLSVSNAPAMDEPHPYTPNNELMEAIDQHNVAKAKALLNAGADINHVGYSKKLSEDEPLIIGTHAYTPRLYYDVTPLSLAAHNGFEDMVTMLLEYRSPDPLIARAGILKTLLIAEQLKNDKKLDSDYSFPPEHTNGILKELFAKPLAINKRNCLGETALAAHEYPYHRISDSIRKKLIDNGAYNNAIDDDESTSEITTDIQQDLAAITASILEQPRLHSWAMWSRF